MKEEVVVFWFRRDLRLHDNKGLNYAHTLGLPVLPVFIFDTNILDDLVDKADRRLSYIHGALGAMQSALEEQGAGILFFHDDPANVFRKLLIDYDVRTVVFNRDYEPDAIKRDEAIASFLTKHNVHVMSFKDQVIFERGEVVKPDGSPYTVYTPYAKKWKQLLRPECYHSAGISQHNFRRQTTKMPALKDIGFLETEERFEAPELDTKRISCYDKTRDYPAFEGTTRLSVALRFGTISIRDCVAAAMEHNAVWLSELIWREFFMQVLYHFPRVVHHSFKPKYDNIKWRNNEKEFALWCEGKTGYPIVDAGMKQLNETGFMHNRVRMITASFLCKHLLIDWRWGEAFFAQKLIDYELSSNNGNWQWAAGSGCDAAPYFRIFNPVLQTKKFDPDLVYIRTWNPAFERSLFPPVVDHEWARKRALQAYKAALE